MQRLRRYKLVGVVLTVAVSAFVALTACSNYEEGERCESKNGNEDCQDGLQCVPANLVSKPFDTSDRCCPVDRSNASHPACIINTNPIAGDAAPAGDTGPPVDAADAADTSVVDAADAAEGG